MKKIAICATKGGVGKTTLTANLGAIIASSGYRVLLVDSDPQPSLSSFYQLVESSGKTGLTELLTSSRTPEPAQTTIEGLDIIASDDPQGSLEHQLLHIPDGRLRMWQALQTIQDYDYVLIDTRGAHGVLVENAVLAADICLSPLPPETLAALEFLRGTKRLVESLQPFAALGAAPGLLHVVFYRYDRTLDANAVRSDLTTAVNKEEVRILKTVIPNRVVYREAATLQIPVHELESKRRGGISAKETMEKLMEEIQ